MVAEQYFPRIKYIYNICLFIIIIIIYIYIYIYIYIFQDSTQHSSVVLIELFFLIFVSLYVVHPYSSMDSATAWKKSCFIVSNKVKVKLATVVEGDQKAPFSIATTPFPGLLHFTLHTYLI